MTQYEDRLKDYVDVKERLRLFYERFPDGAVVTNEFSVQEIGGERYVIVSASAYRSADDPHPTVGHSWLKLPGTTNFTRGSELENTETSAWGRAIGARGIGIDKSVASANEIANKEGDDVDHHVAAETDGLIGIAITQGTQDGELRQTPEGFVLPFRIKDGDKSFIVTAEGTLAETLGALRGTWMGSRVTVWGHWTDETLPAKGNRPAVKYRILHLERIQTPEFTLPAAEAETKELGL